MLRDPGKFKIGNMDRKVRLLSVQEGKGALSESEVVETLLKDVFAYVDYGTGSEDFDEKVFTLENRTYTIHADPDITKTLMQKLVVLDDGDRWYVYSTDKLGRQFIVLKAERRD